MNRELLKKIDRVLRVLLKNGSLVPNDYVVRELSALLSKVDVTTDIPNDAEWNEFARMRELLGVAGGGAGAGTIGQRIMSVRGIITRALDVPVPPTASRFNWILDDKLRDILDRDLEEAESALKAENLKSCMVMCGSILEAALYEYFRRDKGAWAMSLPSIPTRKTKPRDITSNEEDEKWTLDDLIRIACANGLLEEKLEEFFSHGVRQPRNLIHPAAELRGAYRVDPETADACMSALKLALKRISEAKGPPP